MSNVAINENVLSPLQVVRYKKKYLKIMKYFKRFPVTKTNLLIKLRDDIDFNWSFIINTNSNTDLVELYKKINVVIENEEVK